MTQSEKFFADLLEYVPATPDNALSKIGAVIVWAKKAAIEVGCEHKEELLAAADKGIDYLASIDIPQIPDVMEVYIDSRLTKAAKAWLREEVAKVCQD